MGTASNAIIKYEAGQTSVAMGALTDTGDQTTFAGTLPYWSQRSGYAPEIWPDGLITGGVITPAASGTNDKVDVSEGTAYIGGALVSWSAATDVTITRGLTTDTNCITSITATAAGAIAAVAGVDHTAFSETRAANGGPPLIPVTSIEIGQIRTASVTAADVLQNEIFQVPNVHQEYYGTPSWNVDYYDGKVTMIQALPKIHTGGVCKKVCASYAIPIFVDVPKGMDFTLPEESVSPTSVQVYGGTEASESKSLGAGGFKCILDDGATDALLSADGQFLWFKFYPDKAKTAGWVTQATLSMKKSYPVAGSITATCTLTAREKARRI